MKKNTAIQTTDALAKALLRARGNKPCKINNQRLQEMEKAYGLVEKVFRYSDIKKRLKFDKTFLYGAIIIEAGDLEVTDTVGFTTLISDASNFEIYPLVNGRIRLSITYHKMFE